MQDKERKNDEKESNKELQDYNKNSISSTKELIKKLLENSLNNTLTTIESRNKNQIASLDSISQNINQFSKKISNFILEVETNIKKNKEKEKTEKKEKFKKIKTVTESNLKSKFDKIKNNLKIKPKRLKKEEEDIGNKTISNFKEIHKKKFFRDKDKEKDSRKFKRIPTNTLTNFNKNYKNFKTVQNSPKKKIEKEKIRGRNLNKSNIDDKSFITNKGVENKTITKEDKVNKNLSSSKSFILKSITNVSKGEKKITLNKTKTMNSKKGIRGKLFKNIKKEFNELEKINEITEKKVDKAINDTKDKNIKGIEKEEKKNPEETIKEQEKKLQIQGEKISKLSEELKNCKEKLILIEKDSRKGLFMLSQDKTVTITANSISIIDEFVLTVKAEPLQYADSYHYLMDYEVNKLKSKEIYIDNNKVDDTNFEIKNNYYIKIPFEKIFNDETRKIKVIQEFPNEFSNYSTYQIYLKEPGVLTRFLIKSGDDIQIDDVTNNYFKINNGKNTAFFEGKTTNEIIVNTVYLIYSKKYNYQIYEYIPEFKSKENDIINKKEENNKMSVNILARYKKVVITDYGQEIDDIYKVKLSNYPSKIYCPEISYGLILNSKYEINSVELNGQKVEFSVNDYIIDIPNFGAFNNQFGELHYKYKYFKDNDNDNETLRQESIITNNIKNTYCKLIIEIPNNYVILGTNDIYQKSKTNDYEYFYNGMSKEEKFYEIVKLSIKKGEWDIQKEITLKSKENIEQCTVKLNKMFKGGNLIEESYELCKENAEFIDDEKENRYIFNYNNLNTNQARIEWKIKAKNSTTDYIFDGNEELVIKVPEEDKQFFKDLSDKIIKDDNSEFPVYKKLGKWVYNYMTYNLQYFGKDLTAKQIYEKKFGVCEHFTLLYNTLLVSQGIKAVKVVGYALDDKDKDKNNNNLEMKENKENKENIENIENKENKSNKENKDNINLQTLPDNRHCWTLALIDEKWVPLDATWNLFEKNVPLSHIFQNYGNSIIRTITPSGKDVDNEVTKEIIKYIGN